MLQISKCLSVSIGSDAEQASVVPGLTSIIAAITLPTGVARLREGDRGAAGDGEGRGWRGWRGGQGQGTPRRSASVLAAIGLLGALWGAARLRAVVVLSALPLVSGFGGALLRAPGHGPLGAGVARRGPAGAARGPAAVRRRGLAREPRGPPSETVQVACRKLALEPGQHFVTQWLWVANTIKQHK